MVNIYVLKLEKDKYYVGKTNNTFQRLNQHNTGKGAKWTKKYPPIDILYWHSDMSDIDENKITIQMMREFGVNNVRGGSWTKVDMSKAELEKLNSRVKNLSRNTEKQKKKCIRCGRNSHDVSTCYARFHLNGKPLDRKEVTSNDIKKFILNYEKDRTEMAIINPKLDIDDVTKEVNQLSMLSENSIKEIVEVMQSYSEEENYPSFSDAIDNTHYLIVSNIDQSLNKALSNTVDKAESNVKKVFSKIDKKGKKVSFYGSSMPDDSEMKKVWDVIENKLCKDLKNTFSSLDCSGWMEFFVPKKVVKIIQHSNDMTGKGGKGKNVKFYTGNQLSALIRGCTSSKNFARKVMKRMESNGFDHSNIKLLGIIISEDNLTVKCLTHIDRINKSGESYEKSFVLYTLDRINEDYLISNMVLFDDLKNSPEGIDLKEYWRPKDFSFESLVGIIEKKVLNSIADLTIKVDKQVGKAISKFDKKAKGIVKGAKKKLGLK